MVLRVVVVKSTTMKALVVALSESVGAGVVIQEERVFVQLGKPDVTPRHGSWTRVPRIT
jgi:hypothetical protein